MSSESKEARAADYVMGFGKHKGKSLFTISIEDPGYLDWFCDQDSAVAVIVRRACKHPDIARRIDEYV